MGVGAGTRSQPHNPVKGTSAFPEIVQTRFPALERTSTKRFLLELSQVTLPYGLQCLHMQQMK